MLTGAWRAPDLNGVWKLVVAHPACNLRKSSRLPDEHEVRQLIARNDAILTSPHPLRRTLQLMLGSTSAQRMIFYRRVDAQALRAALTGIAMQTWKLWRTTSAPLLHLGRVEVVEKPLGDGTVEAEEHGYDRE